VFYVYLLENKDQIPYCGCTNDLKDRFRRHNMGYVQSIKNLRPWKLIAYFAFTDEKIAFRFEKYMKTGSGREFIRRHVNCNENIG
jgi:putative endonuclease